MTNDQVREAFEADFFGEDYPKDRVHRLGDGYALASAYSAWTTWKAACAFACAAGMERAAEICDDMYSNMTPQEAARYIRAEIKGADHEG
ncbi:hypothetical protein B551_0222540 [Cupriavidus sp. HPC(L)]|uniref:hypothetical protein n=1 Tax=Cupriavidus sp. HPC(L) TaxID=1217418 RepID=UPI000290D89C|nr:hypothetical protein [Cupriavidus sp. HPC(L)]ESH90752.1 hypothetical protein B551_0222540 [Cupriavidus sp. HPC(L)]